MADEFTSLVNDLALLQELKERNPAAVQRAQGELRKSHGGGNDGWVDQLLGGRAREPVLRHQREAARRALDRQIGEANRELGAMLKAQGIAGPIAAPVGRREQFAKAFSQFQDAVSAGKLTAGQAALLQAKFHQLAETL